MIIVAAPSGAGKSSFVEKLVQEEPRLVDIVTYTTRSMRKGETQGHPYYFTTKEDFNSLIEQNFFVEWAQVHTNIYGTPMDQIQQAWKLGKSVIMDVDVQGARTFKEKFPNECKTIFILPPSIDELRRRVISRDGREPEDLDLRMKNAILELKEAPNFDYQVVNDIFETSYLRFKKIIEELLS